MLIKMSGEHLRFLAGVQRVIDRFLDSGDDAAGGGIKPEEVLVLLKEFRDTDAALLLCKLISE